MLVDHQKFLMMQSMKVNLWWQEVQATIKKVQMSVIYILKKSDVKN